MYFHAIYSNSSRGVSCLIKASALVKLGVQMHFGGLSINILFEVTSLNADMIT